MDAETKLLRLLGPNWRAMSCRKVEARALELEKATRFAWLLLHSMRERSASTAGDVLRLNGDD